MRTHALQLPTTTGHIQNHFGLVVLGEAPRWLFKAFLPLALLLRRPGGQDREQIDNQVNKKSKQGLNTNIVGQYAAQSVRETAIYRGV